MSVSNGMSPTGLPSADAVARVGPSAWLGNVMAFAWLVAAELVIASLQRRPLAVVGLSLAAAVMIITVFVQWRKSRGRGRLPTGALGSILLMTSSMAMVIFSGGITASTSVIWRQFPAHLMALASSGLVAGWWHHQERQVVDPLRGRFAAFVMTVVVWSFGYSALSWSVLLGLPTWRSTLFVTIGTTLAALVVWSDAGVSLSTMAKAIIPTTLLAAEIWLTTWWLPTAIVVGTTVATVMCVLYIQVARHLWLKSWHQGRGRRYLLVGLSVVVITLLSARWV